MSKDRGLLSHSIEIIFLALGIYLIIINIVGLTVYQRHVADINTPLDYTTFSGWHDYQINQYVGFNWFFNRLETFPGFNNFSNNIDWWQNLITNDVPDGSNTWATLGYLCNIISMPFRFIWSIFVDIILNIVWFFSLLMPWVSNALDQNPIVY